jgi:Fe-Mn family superoxide dismutase
MFWEIMAPGGAPAPSGALAKAIDAELGGFDKFKEAFAKAATTRFGSGWAWLVRDGGKLAVLSTPNQDTPVMEGKHAVLGCDVWEHAYYLKYQNRRPDYVAAWWNTVNWTVVGQRYEAGK